MFCLFFVCLFSVLLPVCWLFIERRLMVLSPQPGLGLGVSSNKYAVSAPILYHCLAQGTDSPSETRQAHQPDLNLHGSHFGYSVPGVCTMPHYHAHALYSHGHASHTIYMRMLRVHIHIPHALYIHTTYTY
jgi:hypothetical protein